MKSYRLGLRFFQYFQLCWDKSTNQYAKKVSEVWSRFSKLMEKLFYLYSIQFAVEVKGVSNIWWYWFTKKFCDKREVHSNRDSNFFFYSNYGDKPTFWNLQN